MDKKFPCGEQIPDKAKGRLEYGGILEACLHYCPKEDVGGDVNNCEDFLRWYKGKLKEDGT